MLSSQDEGCELEFRSEKIPYHSVHSNSFLFLTVLSKEGLEKYYSKDVSIQSFINKDFFFRRKKNVGHVNVACNFDNFGHVWPYLVILGMIMLMLLT